MELKTNALKNHLIFRLGYDEVHKLKEDMWIKFQNPDLKIEKKNGIYVFDTVQH